MTRKACVFIDLDGTLLNSQSKITEYSLNILRKAAQQGVRIVISTARSRTLHGLDKEAIKSFCGTMILQNGAEIWENDCILHSEYLLPEDVGRIVTAIGGNRTKIASICDGVYYTNYDAETYWGKISGLTQTDFMHMMCALPKLMIHNPEMLQLPNQEKIAKKFCVTVMDSGKTITISSKTATKGNAIRYLQKLWKISAQDCIAIGNDHNDLSAFEACAVRAAVANAEEAVKKQCTNLIASNDENGPARFIADCLKI